MDQEIVIITSQSPTSVTFMKMGFTDLAITASGASVGAVIIQTLVLILTKRSSDYVDLVNLINRNYADFVSLSTRLVDVASVVGRMRCLLLELRGRSRDFGGSRTLHSQR